MASVKSAVEEFKANVLAREEKEMTRLAQHWGQISRNMEQELGQLSKRIADLRAEGKEVTQQMLRRQGEYRSMLQSAAARHAEFSQYAATLIASEQRNNMEQGMEDAVTVLTDAGIDIGFRVVDVAAVEEMVGLLGDGSPVRDVLTRRFPGNWEVAEQQLLQGVAKGWNPRKIAKMMAGTLGGALSDAMRIARTEQLRAYREASRSTYKESGVVRQYKRMAAQDTNTCIACLALDGTVYSVEEPLEDHPNGRCAMVPMIMNRPEPEWRSGEDWFEGLDEGDQRKILGPGKFEAFKDAKFDFKQLAKVVDSPVWGKTVQVRSLAELLEQ